MSGPSTSNERSTGQGLAPQHQHLQQQHLHHQQLDHTTAAAIALANGHDFPNPAVMGHHDDESQYHRGVHLSAAAAQMQQQQLQQQHLQQQHLQHQHLQHQHLQQHPLQQHHLQQQLHQQQLHQQQMPQHQHSLGLPTAGIDYENGGFLVSRHGEGDIIKTFSSKLDLVKYVKTVLNEEEQCKIVINSSKPKAVYFQCERSGSFRTTVKDATKRQRVAYTKRSKCGYRLVANLYPPEKDKAKKMKKEPNEFDGGYPDDDKKDSEMWILRMIHPAHNHPPEPNFAMVGGKKKRAKYTRTLVEKPLHRNGGAAAAAAAAAAVGYQPELLDHHHLQQQQYQHLQQQPQLHHPHLHHPQHHQHHHHDDGSHPSVQDVAVIAAMEAAPGNQGLLNPPVDPSIDASVDPNVDPSVQQHDHAHGHV